LEVAMSRWVTGIVLASVAVSSCSTAVDTPVEDQAAVSAETTQPTAATTTVPTATTLAAPTTEISIPQTDLEEFGVVGMWWPSDERLSTSPESPLVVLVPGGGWVSADPTGLVPLAEALADAGAIAVTITYRTASDDAFFPIPARDVACAVAHAAALARSSGHDLEEVIVVGHSSGAQLGALVALRPLGFSSDCEDPAVTYDRFIGLAGPYDVVQAQRFAVDLFGPGNTRFAGWSDGNPIDHAAQQPELDVLLIHGTGDRTVPIEFTEAFAEALIDGGHAVDTFYPVGVDHHAVYSTEIAARLIASWLSL
jgi:acetyl esterase/lipase